MSRRTNVSGTIYLLCFRNTDADATAPIGTKACYKHAAHYLGWTEGELEQRLDAHRSGHGARLMAVIHAAGLTFAVARTWQGDRHMERRLKRWGGHTKLCPLCRQEIKQQGKRNAKTVC